MKKKLFTGSGTAIITPFNETGIDYEKLAELIEFQIENKTDAIIICGTTGEASVLTDDEHKHAIEFAVIQSKGRVPVIAGTGSNDTGYALYLSQYAEQCGADALLIVTPYYNKTTQNGLIKHFLHIADKSNLPIVLYNVPSRTNLNILPQTYKILSEHPNINSTKEASGNMSQIAQIRRLCGDDLHVYSGNDQDTLPILSLGGIGTISVLSNIVPKVVHDICDLYFKGDVKASMELHLKYIKLTEALFCEVSPIPIKTAMKEMGLDSGMLRMPLCGMEEENKNLLKGYMKELDLI